MRSTAPGPSPTPPPPNPNPTPSSATIKNIIVVIMHNRSFDNLFGEFPGANGVTPTGAGFSQQDKSGKTVTPFALTDLSTPDFSHTRTHLLDVWDQGKTFAIRHRVADTMKTRRDLVGSLREGKPAAV